MVPTQSSGTNAIFLTHLRDHFVGRGIDAYLVGGFLRDNIRGQAGSDVDIALAADPFAVGRELAQAIGGTFVPLSPAYRLARVVIPAEGAERWVVDISNFNGSIEDDLARRDFTVDALALPLTHWAADVTDTEGVIDPFDGLEDLRRGAIRAVRPSVFKDDPARLVRAVRLAASMGFAIEPSTHQLLRQHSSLVSRVSGERVREEFLAILALNRAKEHLKLLDELGLLCAIIPELECARGVAQPKEHYWDVFNHSLETVERAEWVTAGGRVPGPTLVPWDERMEQHFSLEGGDGHCRRTFLKVAALLHDIAKPQTKVLDDSGRTRFFGHDSLGAEMSEAILGRLRFSARSKELVCAAVRHHLRLGHMSQGGQLPTTRAVYRYFRDLGEAALDTLYLGLADYLAARGPELNVLDWRRHAAMVSQVLYKGSDEPGPQRVAPLIDGHDIMAEFHLEPGPLIGRLLESVREARAAGEVQNKDEAVAWVTRSLGRDGPQCGDIQSVPGGSVEVIAEVER